MSDNGEKLEEQKETKPVVMEIILSPENGQIKVNFPFLIDKVATYGFLKMAEKTLDKHYAFIEQPRIIKPQSRIKDIFRR